MINDNNDDISSIELSFNSGSMDTISKKNFIPKIDLIKSNNDKNTAGNSINNLKNSLCILVNDLEEVKKCFCFFFNLLKLFLFLVKFSFL